MKTHTTPTGQTVIVAVVPIDVTEISVFKNLNKYGIDCVTSENALRTIIEVEFLDKPTIIGTVQYPDVFSFNPEPFVQKVDMSHMHNYPAWQAYCNEGQYKATSQESFISLLASWGYYWENPLGEEPQTLSLDYRTSIGFDSGQFSMDHASWKQAESRKLSMDRMIVVIHVKKKYALHL